MLEPLHHHVVTHIEEGNQPPGHSAIRRADAVPVPSRLAVAEKLGYRKRSLPALHDLRYIWSDSGQPPWRHTIPEPDQGENRARISGARRRWRPGCGQPGRRHYGL